MKQAVVGIRGGARISAEGIMASGHVNHTNRPHTWLHRPSLQRERFPCQLGAVHTWHSTEASDVRSNIGDELPQRALALGKVASHNPKSISASGVGSLPCPGQAEHSIAS